VRWIVSRFEQGLYRKYSVSTYEKKLFKHITTYLQNEDTAETVSYENYRPAPGFL
jgi:hypothetical protein